MSHAATAHVYESHTYRGTSAEAVILLAVSDVVNPMHDLRFFASYDRLAAMARVSRSTAIKAINTLVEDGWLERLHTGGSGPGDTSEFRFIFDDSRPVLFSKSGRVHSPDPSPTAKGPADENKGPAHERKGSGSRTKTQGNPRGNPTTTPTVVPESAPVALFGDDVGKPPSSSKTPPAKDPRGLSTTEIRGVSWAVLFGRWFDDKVRDLCDVTREPSSDLDFAVAFLRFVERLGLVLDDERTVERALIRKGLPPLGKTRERALDGLLVKHPAEDVLVAAADTMARAVDAKGFGPYTAAHLRRAAEAG